MKYLLIICSLLFVYSYSIAQGLKPLQKQEIDSTKVEKVTPVDSTASIESTSQTKTTTSKSNKSETKVKETPTDDADTYNCHQILTGKGGGRYYINKNGNKTYIKKSR